MKEIQFSNSNEKYYFFETSTNLPVYMWVNDKKEGKYLALGVRYGSDDLEFKCNNVSYTVPSGTAHFLEHIKFHLKDCDVTERFLDLGCDSNAYTSNKETVFEVYANDNVYDAAKLLLDFVYDDYFQKKIVDDERGIILEEALSKKDNATHQFNMKFIENYFLKSGSKYPVIGREEDIKKISLGDVQLVHNFFYRPENMFMVITGNFDPETMMKTICENEKNREFKDDGKITVDSVTESKSFKEDKFTVTSKHPTNSFFRYTVKTPLKDFKGYSKKEVLVALRALLDNNFSTSSDFYEYLEQNDLITSMRSSASYEYGIVCITIMCRTEKLEEVEKLVTEKLANLEISKKDLSRIINLSKSHNIMKFDSIYSVADGMISSLIDNNEVDANHLDVLKKISIKEILDIYSQVNLNNKMVGTLIGNEKEENQ